LKVVSSLRYARVRLVKRESITDSALVLVFVSFLFPVVIKHGSSLPDVGAVPPLLHIFKADQPKIARILLHVPHLYDCLGKRKYTTGTLDTLCADAGRLKNNCLPLEQEKVKEYTTRRHST
jgi:hypothetical protein